MIIEPDTEAGLVRAVVISLFTWRRASPDDLIDDAERYGWWGDSYPAVADDKIGSRLWLLRRVKLTAATERDAEFYAREALQWLIDDGHVLGLDVLTERQDSYRLNLRVILTLLTGDSLQINPTQWQVIYAV